MKPAFKPYQIVLVQDEGYKFYGEVMSYPTPEGTLMIRQAANCPGTLKEYPLTAVESTPRKFKYVHYAVITGRRRDNTLRSFPVDMLRYDYCAPINFKVEQGNFMAHAVLDVEAGDEFVVARVSETAHPPWTPARWSSFLYGCRHLKTERLGDESRLPL